MFFFKYAMQAGNIVNPLKSRSSKFIQYYDNFTLLIYMIMAFYFYIGFTNLLILDTLSFI